jgi:hypothetical protein
MGVALYVTLEQEIPGIDASTVCGKFLAKAQTKLDGIAKEDGLTPLAEFISTDPDEVRDFLEGEGGVPDGIEIPAEQWFEPSAGLKTVRGLLKHLQEDRSGVPNLDGVIADLKATEGVFVASADRGVRFHLAVDF